MCSLFFFFFKQKTAYEMRISDWSSDVCSSDLILEDMGVDECAVLRSGRSVDAEAIAKCIETMPGAGELLRGFFQCVDDRIFRPAVIDEVAFIAKEADVVSSVMDDKLGDRKSTRLTPVNNEHTVCRLLLEKK